MSKCSQCDEEAVFGEEEWGVCDEHLQDVVTSLAVEDAGDKTEICGACSKVFKLREAPYLCIYKTSPSTTITFRLCKRCTLDADSDEDAVMAQVELRLGQIGGVQ